MSNNQHLRTLEFHVADAPVIMRALSVAACTAMMCGNHDAKDRLDQYKLTVAQFVPDEAKLFSPEEWCEIGIALVQEKSFRVTLTKPGWHRHHWVPGGRLTVFVGDRRFDAEGIEHMAWDDPRIDAVFRVLIDLAPLDCPGVRDMKAREEA